MKNRSMIAICILILFFGYPVIAQKKAQPLSATASPHSVVLTWVQGVIPTGATCPSGTGSTAVTGNNIYRGSAAGAETLLTSVGPVLTYTDTTVTAGSTYFYQVTAINCGGESGKSNEISGTIPNPLPPNPPTGVTETAQ